MNAQFPRVPQEIKEELEIKSISYNGRLVNYGIAYPKGYDKTKKHSVLMCLTGGGFSQELAYYYYHAYSPRETFKEYIKIYLIATNKSLLSYSSQDWKEVMTALDDQEYLTQNGWVISGASNGGVATYGLISALPQKFNGYITIPGSMGRHEFLNEWKNYKVLIVYMDQDYGWIESSKRDFNKLNKHIKDIELFEIKGHGHILPKNYNIEKIYRKYLAL